MRGNFTSKMIGRVVDACSRSSPTSRMCPMRVQPERYVYRRHITLGQRQNLRHILQLQRAEDKQHLITNFKMKAMRALPEAHISKRYQCFCGRQGNSSESSKLFVGPAPGLPQCCLPYCDQYASMSMICEASSAVHLLGNHTRHENISRM